MAKELKIIELGNPLLRAKAKSISKKEIKTKKFQNFCDKLIATCEVKKGVGIAAPQVGVSKRVFVVWSRPSKKRKMIPKMDPLIVINPELIFSSKKLVRDFEGCLSIPGVRAIVPRYKEIEVSYTTRDCTSVKEKYVDFVARIFQHEFDHIEGIVFIDRIDTKDLVTEKEYQRIKKASK